MIFLNVSAILNFVLSFETDAKKFLNTFLQSFDIFLVSNYLRIIASFVTNLACTLLEIGRFKFELILLCMCK